MSSFKELDLVVHLGGLAKYGGLLLLKYTSYLPLSLRYGITNVLSTLVFIVCRDKRNAVKKNLKIIQKKDPPPSDILKVFLEYGRYWAEFPSINKIWSDSTKIYHNSDFPPTEQCFLGVTFHIGNFEMFGNILKRICNSEFNVVAERLKPQYIADFFTESRMHHGIKTVPHDDLRNIIKVLKNGKSLGILCDRMVGGRGVEVRVFGKRVRMPLNIIDYALGKKIPVYIAYCIHNDGVINIYSSKISEDSDFDNTVNLIVSTLEDAIRRFPYQWHVLSAI